MKKLLLYVPVFMLSLLFPLSAPATDWHVPADFSTIQTALDAAQVVAGDRIIVSPGTYQENIMFHGSAITLTSTDPLDPRVVAATVIDGGGRGTVITCSSGVGALSMIQGFTIQNGSQIEGGGFCLLNSSPTIQNNIIIDNGAFEGGGIFCYNCSPAITDNTIRDNWAQRCGGGLHCTDAFSPNLTCNNISNNSADDLGGGIFCTTSSPSFYRNVIKDNTSLKEGGGLCFIESFPRLINNEIINNAVTLQGRGGGGIYCQYSSPILINTTLSNNSADKGGGINCYGFCAPTITNSILWGNVAAEGPEIHVDVTSLPVFAYCIIKGGWPGTGNIDADPLFVGGNPFDFHLTAGSPCIDTGTGGVNVPGMDIDGDPRPLDIPGMGKERTGDEYDIGADEYSGSSHPTPTITSTPIPRPTSTPTVFPSTIPTATPTILPTSLPSAQPFIMLGGYWEMPSILGGPLRLLSYISDADGLGDIDEVEIYYGDTPTGIEMLDDGTQGDFGVGDGIYGFQTNLPALPAPTTVLLEITARDRAGNESSLWPYLTVTSGTTVAKAHNRAEKKSADVKSAITDIEVIANFSVILPDMNSRGEDQENSGYRNNRPEISLAGYMDTEISTAQGGVFEILAVVYDPDGASDVATVEIYYQGAGTGVLLDWQAENGGYATYGLTIPIAPGVPAGRYLFELVATDHAGNLSLLWPYLVIK